MPAGGDRNQVGVALRGGGFGRQYGGGDLVHAEAQRGRLSTTYQPRSSSTLAAVLRPAPLIPVRMTSSVASGSLAGPESPADAPVSGPGEAVVIAVLAV